MDAYLYHSLIVYNCFVTCLILKCYDFELLTHLSLKNELFVFSALRFDQGNILYGWKLTCPVIFSWSDSLCLGVLKHANVLMVDLHTDAMLEIKCYAVKKKETIIIT